MDAGGRKWEFAQNVPRQSRGLYLKEKPTALPWDAVVAPYAL